MVSKVINERVKEEKDNVFQRSYVGLEVNRMMMVLGSVMALARTLGREKVKD